MAFTRVCVAGTFDGLHAGHLALLSKAFAIGEHIIIGLTTDAYVNKYKKNKTKNYEERKKQLHHWITTQGYGARAATVPIDDPFEPALSDTSVDALVVSEETKKRGGELNAMRIAKGLPPLELVVVPMLFSRDGRAISSTRVRLGEIDVKGNLVMPDHMRDRLSQPLGVVLSSKEWINRSFRTHKDDIIFSVGDQTTYTLITQDVLPHVAFIDSKVNRRPFPETKRVFASPWTETIKVSSGPGFISREAREVVAKIADLPSLHVLVYVEGEEDLLTLPVVAYAPLGSVVYYGQPPLAAWACGPEMKGIVEVLVTKEKKQEAEQLLLSFK